MLIDSHCHLDYLAKDQDVDLLIERARTAGVGGMVTISTKLSTFPEVLRIAKSHPDLCWCSVGVHPHHADEEGLDDPAPLLEHAKDPAVIGIGGIWIGFFAMQLKSRNLAPVADPRFQDALADTGGHH